MLLKCDENNSCGKNFEVETFETEKLDSDIEKVYFKCPHCGKEYVSYYTNRYIRKKQELIRSLTSESALKKMKDGIAKDMRKLRKKVEVKL